MERLPAELGRFQIECELGRGGMGVVYRAFDPIVERPVAIKTIRCSEGIGAQLLERLRREAKAVGSLEHPNIVTLFDAGDSEGLFYLVMQLVEGETLRQRMDRQTRFSRREVLDLFRQLLAALEYAHTRGIVHRDVKPANVLITPEGTVKLADFGVARIASPGMSTTGLVVGTPSYMAPEQILGARLDGRSDLFAAGCILYEMVTGRKAFSGGTTTALMYQVLHQAPDIECLDVPGFPPSIKDIVRKSLAKDPADRFESCGDLLAALQASLPEDLAPSPEAREPREDIRPHAVFHAPRLVAALKRHPVALAAGISIAALALISPARIAAPGRDRADAAIRVQPPVPTPSLPAPNAASTEGAAPRLQAAPKTETHSSPAATVATPIPVAPSRSPQANLPVHPDSPKTSFRLPKSEEEPRVATPAAASQAGSFSSWMVRGDVAFQQEHYDEALQHYRRAEQLKPSDDGARRKVSITLSLLGRQASGQ